MLFHRIPFASLPVFANTSLANIWADEWKAISAISVNQFRTESHAIKPRVALKMIHDDQYIAGLFEVVEQGVIAVETTPQGAVWRDSCVEVFLQPPQSSAYFNFEFNAGGCIHASWVTDWQRNVAGDVSERTFLTPDDLVSIQIFHTLSLPINTPSMEETTWYLGFVIPRFVVQKYAPISVFTGTLWRGNAYKCVEHGPYPHWISWSPLTQLNFHSPENFGEFYFEEL